MEELIKTIEWLNMPMFIGVAIVLLFLVFQIIGELTEFFGKTVPSFFKVRKAIIQKREQKKENALVIKEIKELLNEVNQHYSEDNINKRNNWINQVNSSIANSQTNINSLEKKLDALIETTKGLEKNLVEVKSRVLENEADRLRSELFDCGNRCRRNIRLHPEEMEHIRAVFNKYNKVLKQNGSGEDEFKFITNYYNQQDFPDYHEKNSHNRKYN